MRLVNRSDVRGTVRIDAFDDSDVEYESLTLTLEGGEAVHFNSDDLELGNRRKGLTGGTGAGNGTWRLKLSSEEIEFEALAYTRTTDGFLTAMNAVPPEMERVQRVAIFNSGSNANQVSVLRLVNPDPEANNALVRITGTDDAGLRHGTTAALWVSEPSSRS